MEILCPHCEATLLYDEARGGKEVFCPDCGNRFLMPKLALPDQPPAPAPPPGAESHAALPVGSFYQAPDYFAPVGWVLVGLAVFAGIFSFYVGGRFDPGAGLVVAALNPLVWLGVLGLFFLSRASLSGTAVRCPRCRRLGRMGYPPRPQTPGSLWTCPRCGQGFRHP